MTTKRQLIKLKTSGDVGQTKPAIADPYAIWIYVMALVVKDNPEWKDVRAFWQQQLDWEGTLVMHE